ncbi:MAG: hypothetical protein MH321_03310 [Leptospiraceae bacterium]|nr:hypothetical protein [Leptospiraceae bacterium]
MNKISKSRLAFYLCLLPSFYLLIQYIQSQLQNCTENWLLGWDPSARFSISLQMAASIREGNLWKPIWLLLDSPTWPGLRSFLEAIGILIWGAESKISSYLTLLTFFAFILLSHWIIYKSMRSWFTIILASFGFDWMLFHTEPLLIYANTGMLEIQGAVFFLLCVESFYQLQKSSTWNSQNLWNLSIASLLLLFTKYPYALQSLIAILLFFLLQNFTETKVFLKKYFLWFFWEANRRILLPFLLILLSILALGYLGWIAIPNKNTIHLFQIFLVVFVVDTNHFFILESRESSKNLYNEKLRKLWLWIFLPSLAWILIHPDRFASLFPTIKLEQGENNFFLFLPSLYEDLPLHFSVILLAILYSILLGFKNKKRLRQSKFFLYLSLAVLVIIGQRLITSNQQARHIYHVYPVLILSCLFFIQEFTLYTTLCLRKGSLKIYYNRYHTGSRLILQFFILILLLGGSFFYLPHFFQEKIPNTCYVEKKYDVSAIPRWIQEIQPRYLLDGTVLLNDLPKNHINRADSQLILEAYAYENKYKLAVNSKLRDLNNWNQLIRISSSCSEMETISKLRALSEAEQKLQFVQKEEFPSKQESLSACVEQYNLLKD